MRHSYFQVAPDGPLPLNHLQAAGFLSPDALWIIASPSSCHVRHALDLARFCRVAIEKPLSSSAAEAALLWPIADKVWDIHPIDHKLFSRSFQDFIQACRRDPCILDGLGRINVSFHERAGFAKGRCAEDTIADIQWHAFALTATLIRAAGVGVEITVADLQVSRHRSDPAGRFQDPSVWTASHVYGRLRFNGATAVYRLERAKASRADRKCMCRTGKDGSVIADLDLSDPLAYARVVADLMRPVVDIHLDLGDAIRLM
jgi:hypothetical protein